MPENQTSTPTLARIRERYQESYELLQTAVRIEEECRHAIEDLRDAEWQRRIDDVIRPVLGPDDPIGAGGDSGDPIDYTLDLLRAVIEKLPAVSDG